MKSTRHRSWGAITALGLTLAAGAGALGQSQSEPGHQDTAGSGLFSVHFPGGTVAEYADLLRNTMRPTPANIALSDEAGRKTLPPVELDSVALGTALQALQYIAPVDPGEFWAVQLLNSEPPAYAVAVTRQWHPGEPTTTSSKGGPERMLQVFSIKELIDPPTPGGPTPETVLSAVDLALRMAGEGSTEAPAEVRFHTDSGLIILDAQPQQVGAIEGLLTRMRDDVFRRRDRLERNQRERLDNEVALQAAAAKMEGAGARLDFAKQALDQVMNLQQSGSASAEEVRNAQLSLVNAKGDRDMAEIQLRAAKARMEGQEDGKAPVSEADALRSQVAQLTQQVAALQAKIKELESKKK